ncbi:MAG: Hsp20/alpha crystallin family protein [Candidatus Hydrogenedentes bacterium]|nr:Hsp20/alpha crystallin family protein [Candidatus Hydrogenedentota bacterium]
MSEVQNETSEKKRSKLLVGVLSALIVAVCIQGAYMWSMHEKLSKAMATAKSDDGWTVIPNPNKDSNGKPDTPFPNMGSLPDPFGSMSDPTNWDPFQEMAKMRQQMDQLFNQSLDRFKDSPRFGNLAQSSTLVTSPNIDMADQGDKYVITVDMPGAEQSDIRVEIKDQTLTITGKRDQTVSQQKDGRILRQERVSGQFQRSMPLPEAVDEAGMKTAYKDGVFTVTLPKKVPSKPTETQKPQ